LIEKVEQFVKSQLGEDVVEFKKPAHTLADVVGFAKLKQFIRKELIPRFTSKGRKSLAGAGVAGPIGSGKTFIFEAVAAELNLPVLVLKNIRSQWYGQTDVVFERLRRVLEALDQVVIFVDEADTQFGGVGATAHETERRLTGKIQAMMSDPRLRGRVVWLLMTARIHLLSPDIRRPGRVGDLIIPVLDPEGDDRKEFIKWVLAGVMQNPADEDVAKLDELTEGYSAAGFASVRSHLQAHRPDDKSDMPIARVAELVGDHIPPDIGLTRRYQTLQALVNCTRRSLLPLEDPDDRDACEKLRDGWQREIRELEATGIS
jgi:SpoVK/Ycf46/Vps4 family AAA+-type ATPase